MSAVQFGPTADSDLAALRICSDCDGAGLIYDHSSPDPQQHWDRTCYRCCETGVINITEEAA